MIYKPPQIRYLDIRFPPSILKTMENTGQPKDWRTERVQKFLDSQGGKLGLDVNRIIHDLELDISEIHAARLFRREMGVGMREYARQRRLVIAALRLKMGTRQIKQIAGDLGYRSVPSFTRAFRALFNKSPTEFRGIGSSTSRGHTRREDTRLEQPGAVSVQARHGTVTEPRQLAPTTKKCGT